MILDDLLPDPGSALQYMEEYVNNGSPSGFTDINRPKARYSPGSGSGPFPLPLCVAPTHDYTEQYGRIPAFPDFGIAAPDEANWIFLHPEVQEDEGLRSSILSIRTRPDPLVVPTSSGRTVQVISNAPRWYIKLSYPGILGRINRALPRVKAFAGPEISHEIERGLREGILPASFHILHEIGARALQTDFHSSWAMVVREPRPRGAYADKMAVLVPFFALFSKDAKSPSDQSLLGQFIDRWGGGAEQLFRAEILRATIDSYFSLIINMGFVAEMNAQNLLLGVDSDLMPAGIVFRDMMGVEKDLTLRRSLGLSDEFLSAPYKCIARHIDQQAYQIRHSFSFDFKLGEYVLSPLIEEACRCTAWKQGDIQDYVRSLVARSLSGLPGDYLPAGDWYKHPPVMLDKGRPYVTVKSPIYRL